MDHAELAALKARVEAHRLDAAGDAEPFSRKLRRKTGWSAAYAARVIAEYKRFAILAVAAGHRVSPSQAVDEAWHLHLTDTRRYWEEFCPRVLGRPLHHEPSRGGAGEAAALAAQYRQTLASYVRLFGEAPPGDIWPSRPGLVGRARRAAVRAARGLRIPAPLAVIAAPLMLIGCTLVDSSQPGAIQGPEFVWLYVGIDIAALLIMIGLQTLAVRPAGPAKVGQADLGSYELAYLAGGPGRVFATALLRLSEAGHIVIAPPPPRPRPKRLSVGAAQRVLSVGKPLPGGASAIDQAIVEAVRLGRLEREKVAAGPIGELRERLRAAGLMTSRAADQRVAWIGLVILLPVLALGATRLYFGVGHHRPTGFLFMALLLTTVFGWIFSAARVGRPTAQARGLVKAAQLATPMPSALSPEGRDPALAFALYGLAAVAAADFAGFRQVAQAYAPSGGGDGGSGGCSGGGGCGGGGCGG